MFFVFIIFQLMFSLNSSLTDKPGNELHDEAEGTNQDMKYLNESTKFTKCIKKSELQEFVQSKQQLDVKNNIDQFETYWGIDFKPDRTLLDVYSSPVYQDCEIRRQKWNYILENFQDSPVIKRLNSELQEAGIDQYTFCKDIAVTYMTVTYGPLVFEEESVNYTNVLQKKSVQVFLKCILDSKFKLKENEKQVLIPESLYNELVRNSAHVAVVKRYHEDRIARLKRVCLDRIYKYKYPDNPDLRYESEQIISKEY